MKTEQLNERLDVIKEISYWLDVADERIEMRRGFWEQWSELGSRDKMKKVDHDIEITERAKVRLRQRISRLLFEAYRSLESVDVIYNDCKNTVNEIEGYWYERTTTML